MAHEPLKLPAMIIGPADLARAKRDLDIYNDLQHQADLRAEKTGKAEVVHAGRVISELAILNGHDLANADQRGELLTMVEESLKFAPTVTMSFAVDPSAAFMTKIVDWFRATIHPQLLIRIGLQPSIAAGFTMRTPSKIYDFSLRQKLFEQRHLLVRRLHETTKEGVSIKAPTQEAKT